MSDNQELRPEEAAYRDVITLYSLLRNSHAIKVRRPQMGFNGVMAEPIDFCCDVEYRAKEALSSYSNALHLFARLAQDVDTMLLFPESLRGLLGESFLKNKLDSSGDYRALYFRVKNNLTKRAIRAKKEMQYGASDGNLRTSDGDSGGISSTTTGATEAEQS